VVRLTGPGAGLGGRVARSALQLRLELLDRFILRLEIAERLVQKLLQRLVLVLQVPRAGRLLRQQIRLAMLEILELSKTQSVNESVALLLDVVERWAAGGALKDDVSILGFEVDA